MGRDRDEVINNIGRLTVEINAGSLKEAIEYCIDSGGELDFDNDEILDEEDTAEITRRQKHINAGEHEFSAGAWEVDLVRVGYRTVGNSSEWGSDRYATDARFISPIPHEDPIFEDESRDWKAYRKSISEAAKLKDKAGLNNDGKSVKNNSSI